MRGELSVLGAALWSMSRLRANRWLGAHVLREPMARLHTRAGVADPYPIYRGLREQGAFVRARSGARVTARYDCCQAVLRSRDFGVRPTGVPVPDAEMDLGMLDRDPPDHGRLRKLAAPAFTPRAVEGYRPLVENAADRLLTEAGRTGPFDLVEAYAAPLPVTIITALLGLDGADAVAMARHGAAITSVFDGVRSPAHLVALQRAAGGLHAACPGRSSSVAASPGKTWSARWSRPSATGG